MKHLAAYSLLVLSGKSDPTADDIAKLLKEVGVNPDKEAIEQLIKSVKGKKLHDLVREGSKKLATVSAAAGAPAQAATGAPAAAAKKEEKKPEKKEEEADVDMGGLFGEEY